MQYIIHFGKEEKLAKRELQEYLKIKNEPHTLKQLYERFYLFEIKNAPSIKHLGNVLRIAQVYSTSPLPEEIEAELKDKELYNESSNVTSYHIVDLNSTTKDFYEDYLKEYFKKIACKAMYKKIKTIPTTEDLYRKGFPRTYTEYLLIKDYFAKTNDVSNTKERKKEEEKFPYQRTTPTNFAITLLNLAHVKPKDRIIVPFAGIGSLCFEALDRNATVFATTKNLRQIKSNRNYYTRKKKSQAELHIVPNFSEHGEDQSVDAIVCDPYFSLPDERTKKRMYEKFKQITYMYRTLFQEVTPILKPHAPIIFTLPIVRRGKEQLKPQLRHIIGKEITYKDEINIDSEHGVGRTIYICEKA